METISEWYQKQENLREAERNKQRKLMANYFGSKAQLLETKAANDQTLEFTDQTLRTSLGEDYEDFETKLSEKINLPKLKEQYPYSYGEKYNTLATATLKRWQKGEELETSLGDVAKQMSVKTGQEFKTDIGDMNFGEMGEQTTEQKLIAEEFKTYDESLKKSGIEVDYSGATTPREALEIAKQKYNEIKQAENLPESAKPLVVGKRQYESKEDFFNDIRTSNYTKEEIKLKLRDLQLSEGVDIEQDTEDELMHYASDYSWTGDNEFLNALETQGGEYFETIKRLTPEKQMKPYQEVENYLVGVQGAIEKAPEQKKKEIIETHKSTFMQGEEGNFYYVSPEARDELKEYRNLQERKEELESKTEGLELPKKEGLFGVLGYGKLSTEQQEALDTKEEIKKIESDIKEKEKTLEENITQVPDQFNQGFLQVENKILNQETKAEQKTESNVFKTTDYVRLTISGEQNVYQVSKLIQDAMDKYNVNRNKAIELLEQSLGIKVSE